MIPPSSLFIAKLKVSRQSRFMTISDPPNPPQ
jgi:hypothetical protein